MKVKKKQPQAMRQPSKSPERPQCERSPTPPTTSMSASTSTTPSLPKINFDNRIKRKNVLALNEKVAAIKEYDKMPVYKHVGRIFNCSPDQIKRIVQQRDNILQAWEQRTRRSQDAKTLEMKVVRVSMLGKAVYDWIRRMMYYKDFIITDGLIQKMALQFKSAMGLQNFFPHQEWCDKFRLTYNIGNNDTKHLKIGYTQGYSVQIKDIMKDVLTECTPESAAGIIDDDDDERVDRYKSDMDDDDYNNAENKDEDVDIDGDGSDSDVDVKPALGINAKLPALSLASTSTSTSIGLAPTLTAAPRLPPPLQPLHQLLALPIKTNAPPGTTQKVLVATPISTPGGMPRKDAPPMTMTIIPLATLTQSVQQQCRQHQQQQKQQAAAKTAAAAVAPSEKQSTVPPPMLDIKKEIKEEPKDADDEPALAPVIRIKEEIVSEDECEEHSKAMDERTILPQVNLASVAAAIANIDMLSLDSKTSQSDESKQQEESPKEEESPITATTAGRQSTPTTPTRMTPSPEPTAAAAKARSARKTRSNNNNNSNNNQAESSPAKKAALTAELPLNLPPPPPLKKAPTHATRGAAKKRIILNNNNKRHNNNNNNNNNNTNKNAKSNDLPTITSCAEARHYLKLLEDFALYKENFRLIGLITRADEVLRELDDERDQDDVDID